MREKRLHNRICESRLLLPIAIVVVGAMWWLPSGTIDVARGSGLALCYLLTYVVMETTNRNALIRVYSRSISSLFLLLVASMGFLHALSPALGAVVALSVAYSLLLRADVADNLVVHLFHTFLALAIGMVFVPAYVVFVPLFYWHCLVFHRRLTGRAFWGGIIGLLLPFVVVATTCLMREDWTWLQTWIAQLTDWRPLSLTAYEAVEPAYRWAWGGVALLALLGGTYYLGNSFQDKVRTRMLMYIFIMQSGAIALLVALQPHLAAPMLPAMMLSAAPAVGHYFTLQRTAWGAGLFALLLVALVAMGILSNVEGATTWIQTQANDLAGAASETGESAMEWLKTISPL